MGWLGLAWLGLARIGLTWFTGLGFAWLLAWRGLAWPGAAWPGPARAWPGPARPGARLDFYTWDYFRSMFIQNGDIWLLEHQNYVYISMNYKPFLWLLP